MPLRLPTACVTRTAVCRGLMTLRDTISLLTVVREYRQRNTGTVPPGKGFTNNLTPSPSGPSRRVLF